MNIQNMLKQAQKMQSEIMSKKEEINQKIFPGKSSLVNVEVNGKKEVLKIEIQNKESLEKEDLEILEDMILIALNDAFKKVDTEVEAKLGNIASGMPGIL
ncbi:MAG: YbaB/EbfC family nucleoid-associated protein [Bacilli bacterium]